MTIRSAALNLARRTVGVRADEIPGVKNSSAGPILRRMAAEGVLHRLELERRNVRFFASAGLRDAYAKERAAEQEDRLRNARDLAATTQAEGHSPWPADTPVTYAKGFVFTQCPSHRPRYEAPELPGFYGGNQRGRVAQDPQGENDGQG